MSGSLSLETFQRWVQATVLDPDGVDAGTAAAAEELGLDPTALLELVTPGPHLRGPERLAVYSDMIRLRFGESMDEDFRGVAHLVGRERFRALARGYLVAHPSTSHTLHRLGARFADWLLDSAPDVEHRRLAHELARLERAILDVFEGPDASRLAQDDLLALPRERWGEVRFRLAPSLRLFALEYPANAYLSAVFAGQVPPVPERGASHVCVHRTNWRVSRTDLARGEFVLLRALAEGAPLASAFEAVHEDSEAELEALVRDLEGRFREWTELELFSAAEL